MTGTSRASLRTIFIGLAIGRLMVGGSMPAAAEPSNDGMKSRQTMQGKVFCGYQGWFSGKDDGTGIDFDNYRFDGVFKPGCCVIDLWPDMRETDPDERYPTPFRHVDGTVATVFSSANAKTVDRHFAWMKTYGIDGVFLQRFGWALTDPPTLRHRNVVIDRVRTSAAKHDRLWAVMYDLTSLKRGQIREFVMEDWKGIVRSDDPRLEHSYTRHDGKPVVAVWGVGFHGGRAYGLDECLELVRFLQNDPVCGGNAVMLGVPYGWRRQQRDAARDETLHEVLLTADILSPWTVGRYRSADEMQQHQKVLAADRAWLQERGKSYLPVAFPGFSWQNLEKAHGREAELNAIPRRGGRFLWAQALAAQRAGARMAFIAMFDEMNEATAIFKCTNHPPVGVSAFMTYDGLPSDHYLWLSGQIGQLLRGEIEPTRDMPTRRSPHEEK
jgi:hypothetical protein